MAKLTATRIFMSILGTIMGCTAVAFPLATLLHGLGLLATEPPWGFWSAIVGAFFFAVAATEMFSGHITRYAGDLLKAMAGRVVDRAIQERKK